MLLVLVLFFSGWNAVRVYRLEIVRQAINRGDWLRPV